jgi:hypothetical protein
MRVALSFNSILLKKSLESYLRDSISPINSADLIVSDRFIPDIKRPVFVINHTNEADLRVPFSRDKLYNSLKTFLEEYSDAILDEIVIAKPEDEVMSDLKRIVQRLNRKHKDKIDKLIKEYYESI